MTEAQKENLIFALDIGTRSVIGIAGYRDGDMLRILCTFRQEYKNRAVVDGQIEDIAETAKIARQVKEQLEQKLGFPLKNVYIAAAGRVLRTVEAYHEETAPPEEPITPAFISKLELGGIRKAYEAAESSGENSTFFCVGHTVRNYVLDGYSFSTLLGHRGTKAEVSMIVTFLPREVMESLYSAMAQIGLTVAGLTLEPIAAMNVIIPADLRKLNLALCDIGAGTSDIALCDNGSVTAYTMATIAGDEITEEIMQACLVDFQTAESMKMQLSTPGVRMVSCEDILGITNEYSAEDMFSQIKPAVEKLANEIANRILEINGKAPSAVFLVGGGSQTPGLSGLVAQKLGLDEKKVAVGSNIYMKRMIVSEENLLSPEYATPLGIAVTAMQQTGADAFSVTINGSKLHLFNLWDTSVLGVLQMAGYKYSDIMGMSGKSISYQLDGVRAMARGTPASPAEISLNGQPSTLSHPVTSGDTLIFTPCVGGEDAHITVAQLTRGRPAFTVTVEGTTVPAGTYFLLNGQPCPADYAIKNGDVLQSVMADTLEALCRNLDIDDSEYTFYIDGQPQEPDFALYPGCDITYEPLSEVSTAPTPPKPEPKPIILQEPLHLFLNGQPIVLAPRADGTPHQFFDLLAYTDIDPQDPKGIAVQKLNGKAAAYTEPLQEGDAAEIYWDIGRRLL